MRAVYLGTSYNFPTDALLLLAMTPAKHVSPACFPCPACLPLFFFTGLFTLGAILQKLVKVKDPNVDNTRSHAPNVVGYYGLLVLSFHGVILAEPLLVNTWLSTVANTMFSPTNVIER